MKLYKYTTLDAAVKIIENQQIHFARMSDFNDPFEGAFVDSPEDLKGFEADSYPFLLREGIINNFVILSLTRSPFNSLMWAHYGNAHSGCVIEIDVDKAGFNDANLCSIPADYGDIIYTTSKPNYEKAKMVESSPKSYENFSPEKYLAMKAAFLNKQTSWAYEEEVRVVKHLSPQRNERSNFQNQAGTWNIKVKPAYEYRNGQDEIKTPFQINNFMNLFSLPRECVTQIFIGSKLKRLSVAPSHQKHYQSDPDFFNIPNLRKIESYGIKVSSTSAMTTTRSIDVHQHNIID